MQDPPIIEPPTPEVTIDPNRAPAQIATTTLNHNFDRRADNRLAAVADDIAIIAHTTMAIQSPDVPCGFCELTVPVATSTTKKPTVAASQAASTIKTDANTRFAARSSIFIFERTLVTR
jgi:hypothetical protein